MPRMIVVNLPVADLERSKAFYKAIGAEAQDWFGDETHACMVFSRTTFVMLLTRERFRSFTSKGIADAQATCQMLLVLTQSNREAVDAVAERAVAAGGREALERRQEGELRYSRCFEDPDGHVWEALWMHPSAGVLVPEAFAGDG